MAENIALTFENYFEIVAAQSNALKNCCYKIRYDVYCADLGFEDASNFPDELEKDIFDDFSSHYLIKHKSTGRYAGTIRVVEPYKSDSQPLCPFEKYCLDSVYQGQLHPNQLRPGSYCEVSRLAVPRYFRRRQGESDKPFVFEEERLGSSGVRTKSFPLIAVGLYFTSVAHFLCEQHLDHMYVMMERRLASHLGRVGVKFDQAGREIEYHGQRAAYHLNQDRLLDNSQASVVDLFEAIRSSVQKQLS